MNAELRVIDEAAPSPPQSIEAEQNVIGSVLQGAAVPDLLPDDFVRVDHRFIWAAVLELHRNDNPACDVVLVSDQLERNGRLQDAGGQAYLLRVMRDTATPANVAAYAEIVAERARLRRLLTLHSDIETAVAGGSSSLQIVDALRPVLDDFARRAEPPDPLAAVRISMLADLNAGPEAIDTATPPDWISNPALPVAGASFCGSGGTGKTAVVLGEKVRVACGGELYGHPVDMQGPCVLVTAEDDANRLRYILQQVLQDGVDSGELPERAAQRAKSEVRIIGWDRARWGPIVTADSDGNMHRAPVYDLLLELLGSISPVYVTLDPAVLFGAGERFSNDGDAFLASLLHDSALQIKAAMQLIDHVSQTVARDGIVDQYAARGGTAKTDNARLARQLIRITAPKDLIIPAAVTPEDLAEGRLLQLHWTKNNLGPIPPPAFLLRRRFWMRYLRTPSTQEATQARERKTSQRDAEILEANVVAVLDFIREQLAVGTGIRMSLRDVANAEPGPTRQGQKISRDNRRGAIQRALADGRLKHLPLPKDECQGSRTQYLAPAEVPP